MTNCLKKIFNLYAVGVGAHYICIPLLLTYADVKGDTTYNNATDTTAKVNAITNVIACHGPGHLSYGALCALIWPKLYM